LPCPGSCVCQIQPTWCCPIRLVVVLNWHGKHVHTCERLALEAQDQVASLQDYDNNQSTGIPWSCLCKSGQPSPESVQAHRQARRHLEIPGPTAGRQVPVLLSTKVAPIALITFKLLPRFYGYRCSAPDLHRAYPVALRQARPAAIIRPFAGRACPGRVISGLNLGLSLMPRYRQAGLALPRGLEPATHYTKCQIEFWTISGLRHGHGGLL
jgi:hypothetical protein